MDELSKEQRQLLGWLGEAEFSQYGECHGASLDALIERGLARIEPGRDGQDGFIAKGDSLMYRAVSLTDKGRAELAA